MAATRSRKTERAKALERLGKAIEAACESMDAVKRGFVESEFESYRWNCDRLDKLERQLGSRSLEPDARKDLRTERHQLVTESGQLFSHLMRQLRDAAPKEDTDPMAEFLGGAR